MVGGRFGRRKANSNYSDNKQRRLLWYETNCQSETKCFSTILSHCKASICVNSGERNQDFIIGVAEEFTNPNFIPANFQVSYDGMC